MDDSRHPEVIADSEDEGPSLLVPVPHASPATARQGSATSPIQTADFTTQAPRTVQPSTAISAFTEDPTRPLLSHPPIAVLAPTTDPISSATSTNAPKKPRPKPRPAYKGPNAPPDPADTSPSSHNVSSISFTPISTNFTPEIPMSAARSSVAPGAPKPRPRPKPAYKGAVANKPANPSFSTIENGFSAPQNNRSSLGGAQDDSIVNDSIDLFASDIAERAKMRSQQRTSKNKGKQPAAFQDVIELSSDDDEMLLVPSKPKPKPKPKPKQATRSSPRKKAKTTAHDLDDKVLDSTPVSLPVLTSDFNMAPSSQLPPSDPPLPSPATAPPTSTPADVAPPKDITPPTSPAPAPRKRKRMSIVPDLTDDDLDLLRTEATSKNTNDQPEVLPPVPPFFAGSSSSGPPPQTSSDMPNTSGSNKPTKNSRKRKEMAQKDSEVQEILEGDGAPKPKPKRRRKKDEEDEEEWAGDTPAVPPKAKAKPAKKAPAKRKAKPRMQVVVEIPDKSSPRKKTVSPGSSKAGVSGGRPAGGADAGMGSRGDGSLKKTPPKLVEGDSSELTVLGSDTEGNTGSKKGQGIKAPGKKVGGKEPSGSASSKGAASAKSRGKRRAVADSDDEGGEVDADQGSSKGKAKKGNSSEGSRQPSAAMSPSPAEGRSDTSKEKSKEKENDKLEAAPSSPHQPRIPSSSSKPTSSPRYTIAAKSTPMSELIRKVNSLPSSPFSSSRPTHSPYLKSSRSLLRKIAPLHPNRRTPPPPPPRAPPPKKTKKQLELEEKWEMELEDSVEGWFSLPDDERAALRRAKRNAEMGFED